MFVMTLGVIQAQNKMQLNCEILIDGEKLNKKENVKITIIDNSLKVKELLSSGSKFLYNLEYDKEYTVLFEYEGCQAKSIYFNNYTEDYANLTCHFTIDLRKSDKIDILHIAEVYYDRQRKDFAYKIFVDYKEY